MIKPFGDTFEVRFGPYRIVAAYLLLGVVWILVSDAVLALLVRDAQTLSVLQSVKGFGFVVFTSIALFFLVRRDVRVIHQAEGELEEAQARLEELAAFPRLSPNPVLRLRKDGMVEYANDATQETIRSFSLGATDELLPQGVREITTNVLDSGLPIGDVAVTVGGASLRWEFFPDAARQRVYAYASDQTHCKAGSHKRKS